ncbi:MAG: VIT and VWA domain-containing protein [Eubacterium sp.]|nr:VIT and VWA domain-containing protein [Eubacterium sp.]MCM1213850.1 VIT and VWA domain-containing protein [Lachnospiraceae bacterium]MCM1237969.1 VIT and VWA domain-containing protein [Lachnospiraceae bacterium]
MNSMREKSILRQGRKWICCILALLLFLSSCPVAWAAGKNGTNSGNAEENEEEILAPYFIIQGTGDDASSVEHFPLRSTDVTANINGMIAEIYVAQTYVNEGDTPINANYVFPTSSDVVIHGMTMVIGNERITAQIKEKEEAKEEYEEAKSEGKSASLMEQKRPNVFTMDVANIMPGDVVSIELHYTELITPKENIYEFIFPTVVGPRYAPPVVSGGDGDGSGDSDDSWVSSPYLAGGATPPGDYNITVNLSTGVPIAEVTSKSHAIRIDRPDASTAQVTLADSDDYAGNRDFILKYKLTGEEIQSGLALSGRQAANGAAENFFMLTIQPPERFEAEDIPPREYIFVLDVSGSMYGYPLDTAKDLIRDLVSNLNETDTFNLILFANESTLLSPASLPATAQNIKEALRFIDEQEGGGGTSLLPALEDAVSIPKEDDAARSVVIITDGYISNESEIVSYITDSMGSASFFSFGIGSSVNDYLIRQIAGCGLGESFIVTDSEDAAESAANFRTYIEAPLLTDISIVYRGFDVYDVEPAVPSILYASQPIVLFGKWRGKPGGTITITGKAGGEDYVQEIPVNSVAVDAESEATRYLWARTHLDRIAGYGSIRNDESVKDEITQLGLEYDMITPYTSFIAVSETIRNTEGESTDVDQALPLPQRVSGLSVGGGYRAYSEPGTALLILPLAAVALIKRRSARTKKHIGMKGTE